MYTIRPAMPHELTLLPAIEQAAGMMFLQTRYPDLASGPNVVSRIDPERDRVWVAATAVEPVGFALVRSFGKAVHLHELDVHPDHARQGLGRRLIEAVCTWARERGAPSVTLTTFADVPWNAPYYLRLGFTIVAPELLAPHLREVMNAEKKSGIVMERRVAMEWRVRAAVIGEQ